VPSRFYYPSPDVFEGTAEGRRLIRDDQAQTARLCVIGGGGYLGTKLVGRLLTRGHDVTVFDTFWFGDFLGEHRALRKVTGDMRDTDRVAAAMAGCDAVILLACLSNDQMADLDPDFTREVNLTALQRLILAAKAARVRRMLYASTTSVYGMQDVPRVVETTPFKPLTLYSRYKAEIEEFLVPQLNDAFVGVIVRGATICGYSPRMRLDLLVNVFCWLALKKGVIAIVGGKQIRPLIHIEDLIDFYELALDANPKLVQGEAFNVTADNYTVQQIADMVRDYTGCKLEYAAVSDPRSYPADSEKAALRLGYRTKRTIQQAMVEVCDAIKAGKIAGDASNYNIKRYKELVAAR
jgi:nucleoside-diphosphate-sugar epimerase